jgi:hypothetical protein
MFLPETYAHNARLEDDTCPYGNTVRDASGQIFPCGEAGEDEYGNLILCGECRQAWGEN